MIVKLLNNIVGFVMFLMTWVKELTKENEELKQELNEIKNQRSIEKDIKLVLDKVVDCRDRNNPQVAKLIFKNDIGQTYIFTVLDAGNGKFVSSPFKQMYRYGDNYKKKGFNYNIGLEGYSFNLNKKIAEEINMAVMSLFNKFTGNYDEPEFDPDNFDSCSNCVYSESRRWRVGEKEQFVKWCRVFNKPVNAEYHEWLNDQEKRGNIMINSGSVVTRVNDLLNVRNSMPKKLLKDDFCDGICEYHCKSYDGNYHQLKKPLFNSDTEAELPLPYKNKRVIVNADKLADKEDLADFNTGTDSSHQNKNEEHHSNNKGYDYFKTTNIYGEEVKVRYNHFLVKFDVFDGGRDSDVYKVPFEDVRKFVKSRLSEDKYKKAIILGYPEGFDHEGALWAENREFDWDEAELEAPKSPKYKYRMVLDIVYSDGDYIPSSDVLDKESETLESHNDQYMQHCIQDSDTSAYNTIMTAIEGGDLSEEEVLNKVKQMFGIDADSIEEALDLINGNPPKPSWEGPTSTGESIDEDSLDEDTKCDEGEIDLTEVAGVGEATKTKILQGVDVDMLINVEKEDLLGIDGVGEKTAEKLMKHLEEHKVEDVKEVVKDSEEVEENEEVVEESDDAEETTEETDEVEETNNENETKEEDEDMRDYETNANYGKRLCDIELNGKIGKYDYNRGVLHVHTDDEYKVVGQLLGDNGIIKFAIKQDNTIVSSYTFKVAKYKKQKNGLIQKVLDAASSGNKSSGNNDSNSAENDSKSTNDSNSDNSHADRLMKLGDGYNFNRAKVTKEKGAALVNFLNTSDNIIASIAVKNNQVIKEKTLSNDEQTKQKFFKDAKKLWAKVC